MVHPKYYDTLESNLNKGQIMHILENYQKELEKYIEAGFEPNEHENSCIGHCCAMEAWNMAVHDEYRYDAIGGDNPHIADLIIGLNDGYKGNKKNRAKFVKPFYKYLRLNIKYTFLGYTTRFIELRNQIWKENNYTKKSKSIKAMQNYLEVCYQGEKEYDDE